MTRCFNMPTLTRKLGVSRSTILRWTRRTNPRLRLYRLGGTFRVLVAETELHRFLRVTSYETGRSEYANPAVGANKSTASTLVAGGGAKHLRPTWHHPQTALSQL